MNIFARRNNNNSEDVKIPKIDALIAKIRTLHQEKYHKGIKNLVNNTSFELLVVALEEINEFDVINLFLSITETAKMGQFFLSFNRENQIKILSTIRPIVLKKLLEELNADDVVEILRSVDAHLCKKIILSASSKLRVEIKQIKDFDQAQIGSIMNTTFLYLDSDMQVGSALSYLRKKRDEFDIEQEIFVINEQKIVVGKIKIQNLFFWDDPNTSIEELMDKSFITIFANEDIDDAIDLFQKYHSPILGVLNSEKQLIGIINNSDIISEILEENMEDVHKFYGIVSTAETYLRSSVFEIVKSRKLWLILLLFATTLTTLIIDKFEVFGYAWTAGISSAVLVPIIPVITDMSGNAGSQATATIIQALSSNEIKRSDFSKVLKKEFCVALCLGSILSVVNFLRLFFYFLFFPINQEKINFGTTAVSAVSAIIGDDTLSLLSNKVVINSKQSFFLGMAGAGVSSISLFFVVVISKILGAIIPFLALRLDYDPAAFSTPVLTTVLDVLSAIIFFGLGIIILKYSSSAILGKEIINGAIVNAT